MKQRLSNQGKPLLEYPPVTHDQNEADLEKLTEMIKNEEGCHLYGQMNAKKVAGYIYINERRHERVPNMKALDFSHKVNHFSFGIPQDLEEIKKNFDKTLNPLDGSNKETRKDSPTNLIQYYLKVVPITFKPLYGRTISANQYTANSHKVDFYHKNNVVIRLDIVIIT